MSYSESNGQVDRVNQVIETEFEGDAFAALQRAAENLQAKDARKQMQVVPKVEKLKP